MMGEVISQDMFLNWSLNQLANEFGIARETVTRRIRDAGIVSSGMRRGHPVYRVGQVAQAILSPSNKSEPGANDPDMMTPKERSDWFRAENDRLKFEKELGLLVGSDAVMVEMAEIAKMGLSVLETLPDILERDFMLEPKVISGIEERVDALREQWADKLEK